MDDLHKLQAKSTSNKKGHSSLGSSSKRAASSEDLVSESTTTLQGSTTQQDGHGRKNALPALLPDEILNAAPTTRPPTPPQTESSGIAPRGKPNKLKFLDRVEKPPKDVKLGNTTIRVLDDEISAQKRSKPSLAPKSSKASRNSRDNWFKRDRSTAHVNGLRRAAGGPSGFVRR